MLAGTLTLPLSAGPYLAVILVHGPAAQPRDHTVLGRIADYFTLNGVAVLTYDMRGVGGSTGNWNDATLDDLAGDTLAAAAPGISPIAICHSSNNGLPGGTDLQRATWVASAPGDFRGALCRPKAVVPRSGNPCPIHLSYGATSAPSRRRAGGAIGSPCGTFLLRPQKCSQQRPNLPKTKLSRAGSWSAASTSRWTWTSTPSPSRRSCAAASSGISSDPTGPRSTLHQPCMIAWSEMHNTPPGRQCSPALPRTRSEPDAGFQYATSRAQPLARPRSTRPTMASRVLLGMEDAA